MYDEKYYKSFVKEHFGGALTYRTQTARVTISKPRSKIVELVLTLSTREMNFVSKFRYILLCAQ